MLSLTSVSASEDDIWDVADEFMLPCQRVRAMTITVYMAAGVQTGVAGSQATRLEHSVTTLRYKSCRTVSSLQYSFDTAFSI